VLNSGLIAIEKQPARRDETDQCPALTSQISTQQLTTRANDHGFRER
jgi:hypothetical protein